VSDTKEIMSAVEAAAYLGTHVETVRRLARNSRLPSFKVGRDWRFRRDVLRKWAGTPEPGRKAPLVLIFGQDADDRGFIGLKVRQLGYRVIEAGGSDEALLSIYLETPGLILLDLTMPGMNGLNFLAELRASYAELPVALIIENLGSDSISEAIQYGPLLVLAKPVYEQHLKSVLQLSLGDSNRFSGKGRQEVA
jgi:excisionase family DNA binding protein